jgi:hypothetical protein
LPVQWDLVVLIVGVLLLVIGMTLLLNEEHPRLVQEMRKLRPSR